MVEILTRAPSDYQLFRESVAKKFLLTTDYYKQKFYALCFSDGMSNNEFISKLTDLLSRWIKIEKVQDGNYQQLFDFIIKNQFFRKYRQKN